LRQKAAATLKLVTISTTRVDRPVFQKPKAPVQARLALLTFGRREAYRDGLEDPFLWVLARVLDLYLFEDERCRNVVRFLVDSRIDLRKKQIIMLSVEGFNQSDIARQLGISRQAVSKTVSSEAFKKVSMMYRSGVWSHHPSSYRIFHSQLYLQSSQGLSLSPENVSVQTEFRQ
jgi:hypothetical protein